MKKTVSILLCLIMLFTVCGCNKPKYQTTVEADGILRVDFDLTYQHGDSAPYVVRDPEQIKNFAQFINNAPITKIKDISENEQTDGVPSSFCVYYESGESKSISFTANSFTVGKIEYTLKDNYLLKLCNAVDNLAYIPDVVTVGDLANMLTYTGIKTEADRNVEYIEVAGFGWDTSSFRLTEVLKPQNAKALIDAFLKQHFYALETDVLTELSLNEKAKLTTEDVNNICDTLFLKFKEIKPKLSFDFDAGVVAKAEISDKENSKSLTVTGKDLEKLVDYLNKTPITNVDFVGVASGIYKSVTLFDKDGNEIFKADVNSDGFVNGYCQYSVQNNYLGVIFDNVK